MMNSEEPITEAHSARQQVYIPIHTRATCVDRHYTSTDLVILNTNPDSIFLWQLDDAFSKTSVFNVLAIRPRKFIIDTGARFMQRVMYYIFTEYIILRKYT